MRGMSGWVGKLPSGRLRAVYRDAAGDRHSELFDNRRQAKAFLATAAADIARGQCVDPRGGQILFREWQEKWFVAGDAPSHGSRVRGDAERAPGAGVRAPAASRTSGSSQTANVPSRVQPPTNGDGEVGLKGSHALHQHLDRRDGGQAGQVLDVCGLGQRQGELRHLALGSPVQPFSTGDKHP